MRKYFLYTLNDPILECPKYVGISNNPERRFEEHIKDISCTKKTKWIHSLLDQNLSPILKVVAESDNIREVINWEIKYIEKFKEIYNLTNSTLGGEYYAIGTPIQVFDINGNYIESFTSMIEYCELYNLRESFVSAISGVCLRKRNHAHNLIFRYIDDTVTENDLIRLRTSLRKNTIKSFYVLTIDGEIKYHFNSIKEAVKNKFASQAAISSALSKKTSNCRGYLICNSPNEYKERLLYYNQCKSFNTFETPLNQYTLDGKFVDQFWTYSDAAKQFKTQCINTIRYCAVGKYPQAKGYYWKFATDVNDKDDIQISFDKNTLNKYSKIVQLDSFGKVLNIFKTKSEASHKLGIPKYFITDLLKGKKKDKYNYTLIYYNATKPLNIGEALTCNDDGNTEA